MKTKKRNSILIFLVCFLLAACNSDSQPAGIREVDENSPTKLGENYNQSNDDTAIPKSEKHQGEKENQKVVETKTEDTETEKLQLYIKNMTLEEKVGQVFIVAFRKNNQDQPVRILEPEIKQQIQKYYPGGVILFNENIDTIPQTRKLISDMQSASKIPLFVAVDEEGGRVSRLNSSSKMHATKLPGNGVLGKTEDIGLAYQVGILLGRELSSLGFNMNFAPVADINTNPRNIVIGSRAFGSDPEKVGAMVHAVVKGLQQQNISAVLKHFPGHGDTELDTHQQAVVVNHHKKRLEQVEFVPFRKGIEAGADGVMTAHIQVPKITEQLLPATLSKEILTGILRKGLGHRYLIITDALEMGAIANYWTSGQAAVLAFKAGADILLMPASFEEAYLGLLSAVKSGEISEKRLDESVLRILQIKQKRKVLEMNSSDHSVNDPERILGNEQHQAIVKKILEKAAGKQ